MASESTELGLQLDHLLSEGVEVAKQRETATFDELVGGNAGELVLFGAGNLGRRTLAGLRKVGVEPICFLDNNAARWGDRIDGIPVLSPSEGARLYGSSATFVITVWGASGTDRMSSRISQLRQLGCKTVVTFLPLYWKYPEQFLPHYTIDLPHRVHMNADSVRMGFVLMADEVSCREYLAQLRFRLWGDFDYLTPPVAGAIYFREDLFKLGSGEVLVDCGAFDGDTVSLFLDATMNHFDQVIAFEPDPSNFAKLVDLVRTLPHDVRQRISLHQAATGEINEKVRMDVGIGPASHIGNGEQEVESLALDSVLQNVPVTFIKMDIEGSELATLAGARTLIKQNAPILAISAYHRQDDLWNIPLLIHGMDPGYAFYLRPHMIEGWDLVCYAVPSIRIA